MRILLGLALALMVTTAQAQTAPRITVTGEATVSAAPCSSYAMDVIIGIIWWVELNDPVNFGKVKTALGDICA